MLRPNPRPASLNQPAGSICSTFSLTGGRPYPTSFSMPDRLFSSNVAFHVYTQTNKPADSQLGNRGSRLVHEPVVRPYLSSPDSVLFSYFIWYRATTCGPPTLTEPVQHVCLLFYFSSPCFISFACQSV